ncbi:hypothetical protein BDK51DRAFT_18475 [Blyttiomyces helicus]|uniref:SWIRM-domain-containing protein n=1 Tax=Blyttiomyces helicus TaxID=388810 RepID=A0A4P9WIT1_9FUNG|nr:hypothetical protein BDK51DRAFT_18475 [Blyttiomyces helicus]|eukprot:RKO92799.1 hypothetical protein BDK51DRAFT_18475 [Blyttiomyces helicus]
MLSHQTQEIVIPSYSAWFNIARINDIEKRSLPEFFNSKNRSKTPSIYKDYRDFMINTYRLNPLEYLTVTACRRNLAGDVCAIIRVHGLLEQWGLINYQVDPDSRPSIVGPAFTGHFRVTADTPRGLQPLYPNVPKPAGVVAPESYSAATSAAQPAPTVPDFRASSDFGVGARNIYASVPQKRGADDGLDDAPDPKRPRQTCTTCGVDCTATRYHNTKVATVHLCSSCYLDGRFPSSMTSGDFTKLVDRPTRHASDDEWTDQETLLLLEGLEMYDEDWTRIATHVGTRTRDQCILAFLKLPIEDPYVGRKASELGPLQFQRIPFAAGENPVLSLAAFLASVVPPDVAKAAAAEAAAPSAPASSTTPSPAAPTLPTATATALGAAAAKATHIAHQTEREMQALARALVEAQLSKMALKLRHFEELEALLEAERRDVERERQRLFLDRVAFRKLVASSSPTANAGAGAKSLGPEVKPGATLARSEAALDVVDEADVDPVQGVESDSRAFMITMG